MAAAVAASGWRAELDQLLARFGRLFVRAEPRSQAGRYLEGLLGPVERKNGWQRAEHRGDTRPWRTQRVLSHALWDEDAARDLCRDDAVEPLSPTEAAPTTMTVRPAPQPGEVFRDVDASWCPELVVIPAGWFLMSSPDSEEGRNESEGPQHEVTIGAPFAMGRYPVTFEEYDAFCAATGREKPGDRGWGRGRRPVIYVSWEDAQAYVAWLQEKTGKAYRLPSEAEWEYACRAGTTTRFFWGDDQGMACRYANGADLTARAKHPDWTVMNCEDGFVETAPVGSFEPNAFGLFDMSGNVWEWIEDRWRRNYEGAPTDGSAWVKGTDSARVVRGGSWVLGPGDLRSANRYWVGPDVRDDDLGFRVARALTP